MILLFIKKRMLPKVSIFFFLWPDTFTYSQERMVKKKAPINSSQRALSESDDLDCL